MEESFSVRSTVIVYAVSKGGLEHLRRVIGSDSIKRRLVVVVERKEKPTEPLKRVVIDLLEEDLTLDDYFSTAVEVTIVVILISSVVSDSKPDLVPGFGLLFVPVSIVVITMVFVVRGKKLSVLIEVNSEISCFLVVLVGLAKDEIKAI